jgi:glutamate carboxypeptidase
MVEMLKRMVSIESPSRVSASQDPIFTLLRNELDQLEFTSCRVRGQQTGGYLYARPHGRVKHSAIQLLLGHCDTVWPIGTLQEMPLMESENTIKGPGTFDMKAGLTQIIFALHTIRALKLAIPVLPVVLINSDEEIGSRESRRQIERLARVADRAYVIEPPIGDRGLIKTARKGIARYIISVKGEPAHAGLDPGKGASAIVELSHQIQRLFAMNDLDKGITVNVGMIEGGIAANVVAPESKAIIDVRVLTQEDASAIDRSIRALKPVTPNTHITIEGEIGRPPMEKTELNHRLWRAARAEGARIGLELEATTAGGGSDGNITSQYCATLDGLGTTGDGAHAQHEFIYKDKLVERTILLTLLLCLAPISPHRTNN